MNASIYIALVYLQMHAMLSADSEFPSLLTTKYALTVSESADSIKYLQEYTLLTADSETLESADNIVCICRYTWAEPPLHTLFQTNQFYHLQSIL